MSGDIAVLGYYHDPACLVVRYRKAAENREYPFPWCTCKRAYPAGSPVVTE